MQTVFYNVAIVIVSITWDLNESQEFNFIIEIIALSTEEHTTFIALSSPYEAHMNYNTNYTISARARSCGENSSATTVYFIERKCSIKLDSYKQVHFLNISSDSAGCPSGSIVIPSNTQLMCDGPSPSTQTPVDASPTQCTLQLNIDFVAYIH